MANYTDDFEGYSTGTSLPAGWTSRWDTPTQWAIADYSGDQALKITPNSNRCFASMDAIDSDANRDNVEILAKFRTTTVVAGAHAHVVARGSGTGTSENGYVCGILDDDFRVGKYVSATFTAIGSTVVKNISANTWYWIRFRVNGTSLKARLWADGGSEPGTWDVDTTDSSISGTGWAGCFDFFGGTGYYSDWTDIAVATNGDTASMSGGTSTDLTVQEASHAHAADNLALTTEWLLSVAEAAHAHAADNIVLSIDSGTDLTVQDAAHAHAADNIALTLDTTLQVHGAYHGHAADNAVLSLPGETNLVVQEASHAHAADTPTLTTEWLLAVAEALHVHAADAIVLSTGSMTLTQDDIDAVVAALLAQAQITPIHSNVKQVNDVWITGSGIEGSDEWRPA